MTALLAAIPAVAGEVKDPTRPPSLTPAVAPAAAPSATRPWRLSSVLISPDRRVAVIDGNVLRLGERIDGAELVEIQSHAVKLRRGERFFTIDMSANVKEPATTAGKGATTP